MKPLKPGELIRHLVRTPPRLLSAEIAFRRWTLLAMIAIAVIAAFCALYGVEIILSLFSG